MATPAPSDKVRDKEYSSWLKVTLALYYMKSGLHTFIQNEVDCLHQTLVQKIYGGQTVPLPPCTTCNASLVNRNKFTGVWEFKEQCNSYCHVWLHELLKLHASPKSEKIYWDNSDVPSWPFKPWECAKVFMPRGQQPSNTGPAECDAQALLTVLANCKHFHSKLSSQGLGLTHTVSTIRNKVMHDSEMKLSDADRMSFIQQIIQLLEDPVSLKSSEDCKAAVSNIHTINDDSVNVFFNLDLEMTALRAAVHEFRQELGMQEKQNLDSVDLLKEEYKQLKKQLTNRLEDVEKELELHGERLGTVEENVELHGERLSTVEENVELQGERLGIVEENVELQGERLGIVEVNVELQGERLGAVKEIVYLHGERLSAVEENLELHGKRLVAVDSTVELHGERFDAVEKNIELHGKKLGSVKKNVELHGERLSTVEEAVKLHGERLSTVEEDVAKLQVEIRQMTMENKSCMKETSRKRNQETDGLKQLKSQTENKLDSIRKLGLIATKQMEEAKKLLRDKRSVVIKGNPGEGKTTTALHLIDDECCRDRRVLVTSPKDWMTIDTDWVDIVILEDIFGQFGLDQSHLREWLLYLPTIMEHIDAGKLKVIVTTRVDILAEANTYLGLINLFCDEFALTLSSDKLQESEKMKILNKELHRYKKDLQDDDKKECIASFNGLIGFPQCCSYFAGDNGLFAKGPDFFKEPEKLFSVNISRLDDHRFLSLAFLFCTGGIYEQYLSLETLPEWENSLLIELANHLNISKKKASVMLLRKTYDNFSGLYVRKFKSLITFSHNTVLEAVGLVLGKHSPEMVVKYCDLDYLNQRTYAAESEDKRSYDNVFIPVAAYGLLAERIKLYAQHLDPSWNSLSKHSAIKQHQFVIKLKDKLQKCGILYDFLCSKERCMFGQNLLKGDCETFLQFVLQSDGNTAWLVLDQFLEFLICSHDIDTFDTGCWRCNEKRCLLDLALYYNHLDIADKLISMKAKISPISLCNAVKHGNIDIVKTILESLKRGGSLKPQNRYLRESLCRAFISGNPSLVELLLKEGIEVDSSHVMCVVEEGDIDALVKLVEYLKHSNKWDPLHEKGNQENLWKNCLGSFQKDLQFSKALVYLYSNEKLDMAEFLLKEGVKITMDIFLAVLQHGSYTAAKNVIQDLKDTNQWNPESDCISKAGEIAYSHECNLFELLIQINVSFAMKNLPDVVSWGSEESITKVLQHLKINLKWDPKSDYASQALGIAFGKEMSDVCVLLVKEGIPLTMGIITDDRCWVTKESLTKVIEHLRERKKWDPKSDIALETLKRSYIRGKNDMSEQLLQDGVILTMSYLPEILHNGSRDSVIKAIHHLKDNGKWDVNVDILYETLRYLLLAQKYDVCDILIQHGIILNMEHLPYLVNCESSDFVPKAIQHLKVTGNWYPQSFCASEALTEAYRTQKYDVCDLLIHEGVSFTMLNLRAILRSPKTSVESVKRAIKHLKDSNGWHPKWQDMSTDLQNAYICENYSLFDLLVQEGVSLTMVNLPNLIYKRETGIFFKSWLPASVESVTKVIHHLKNTNNWDANSHHALSVLQTACVNHMYDISNLLLKEGVPFKMKNILDVVLGTTTTPEEHLKETEFITQRIKHLKDTDTWDPSSEFATHALEKAFSLKKYAVIHLLLQENISPTMKIFAVAVDMELKEWVTTLLELMKITKVWDPASHLASYALELAFWKQNHDVCNLLIHEKVSLTMKNLPGVVCYGSIGTITKAIQLLKEENLWDHSSDDASLALAAAYGKIYPNDKQNCEVSYLLIQEGVSLKMKDLWRCLGSYQSLTKVIHHLKEKGNWDPQCESASVALQKAYMNSKYDVCDLLIQEGIPPRMENLLLVINYFMPSKYSVSRVVKHLKDKGYWDPQCESASVAL